MSISVLCGHIHVHITHIQFKTYMIYWSLCSSGCPDLSSLSHLLKNIVCMCACILWRPEEHIDSSGAGVMGGCQEPNLDPLKEQNVLLATELPTSPTRGLKFLIFLSARIIIVPLCPVSLSCMYVHMILYVCMYDACMCVWGVWSCKIYCLGQFRLKGKMERALEQPALGDGRA